MQGVGGGGGGRGAPPPPPPRDDLRFSNITGILQKKYIYMWFISIAVEQETSAPPPKKSPGSAPVYPAKMRHSKESIAQPEEQKMAFKA